MDYEKFFNEFFKTSTGKEIIKVAIIGNASAGLIPFEIVNTLYSGLTANELFYDDILGYEEELANKLEEAMLNINDIQEKLLQNIDEAYFQVLDHKQKYELFKARRKLDKNKIVIPQWIAPVKYKARSNL